MRDGFELHPVAHIIPDIKKSSKKKSYDYIMFYLGGLK